MKFADLGLSDEVLRAVSDAGYSTPTPIQQGVIPYILMGRDILGCAQTGTGKTASFTLPMIDILTSGRTRARMPRTLILEPTRELAAQVAETLDVYGKYNTLSKALIIGGESMDEQTKLLDKGVDILIATPGRLLDVFDRGGLLLNDVKVLVIDEADRMLDMGFIPDVEKIVSLLNKIRQTLFFSATVPQEIRQLSEKFLINPKQVSVKDSLIQSNKIEQAIIMVSHSDKRDIKALQKKKRDVLRKVLDDENVSNALIFCNRKRDVEIVHKSLKKHGYDSATLHGNMAQPHRTDTLAKFKANEISMLVCSDVAARGIDVASLSHVFNFDVPIHPEDYIHRIGRTGRAGKSGKAYTIAWKEEEKYLSAITKLVNFDIPTIQIKKKKLEDKERHRNKTHKQNTNKKDVNVGKITTKSNKQESNNSYSERGEIDGGEVVGMGNHIPEFLTK